MKILNLYAGIGGNRKLWGDKHDITAVEINPDIAAIYSELYPQDKVIIGDAHEYLLRHFHEFDFIWTSPPCQSHSQLQRTFTNTSKYVRYPDMTLYQEIILLQTRGGQVKYCIENVKPYYKPLIPPAFEYDRHLYWASDFILTPTVKQGEFSKIMDDPKALAETYGFDIEIIKKHIPQKNFFLFRQVLRNCVKPEDGKIIFERLTQ